MKLEIRIPEVVDIFKGIQEQPEQLYEMIRADIRETIGQYLSGLMEAELTHFLGRKRYERLQGDVNHRNGSYGRNFTLKGIGEVDLQVPRDRKGNFKTHVIPRGKRYEDTIRQDLCLMFLTGISTRSLSMISKRLIGRKISAGEISNVNKQLIGAAEEWRTRDNRAFRKWGSRVHLQESQIQWFQQEGIRGSCGRFLCDLAVLLFFVSCLGAVDQFQRKNVRNEDQNDV